MTSPKKDIIGIVRGIDDNSRILEGYNDETVSMTYGTWKSLSKALLIAVEALESIRDDDDSSHHYQDASVALSRISSLSVE